MSDPTGADAPDLPDENNTLVQEVPQDIHPEPSSISVGKYGAESTASHGFWGWIEPENKSWILYLDEKGRPSVYYSDRDPETGAVKGDFVVINENALEPQDNQIARRRARAAREGS